MRPLRPGPQRQHVLFQTELYFGLTGAQLCHQACVGTGCGVSSDCDATGLQASLFNIIYLESHLIYDFYYCCTGALDIRINTATEDNWILGLLDSINNEIRFAE